MPSVGVTHDVTGVARGDPPTVGAFEYGSGPVIAGSAARQPHPVVTVRLGGTEVKLPAAERGLSLCVCDPRGRSYMRKTVDGSTTVVWSADRLAAGCYVVRLGRTVRRLALVR